MPISLPFKCWRDRDDCEPLHSVESFGDFEPETEQDFEEIMSGAREPDSFVCAGCVHDSNRAVPQDAFRLCWKNDQVDEIGEYDEQDLTHTMMVISQALGVLATRRVKGETIEVPTMANGDKWEDQERLGPAEVGCEGKAGE